MKRTELHGKYFEWIKIPAKTFDANYLQ